MNRNTSKIAGYALALVVLLAGLSLGGVAAQSGSTELVTGVDDMNTSGPVNVTVTVEGLDGNQTAGNGTVVDETTLSVAAGALESYDYQLVDADRDYDELHVTATTADADLIASTDWGTLQRTSGGAAGGLSGGDTSTVAVGVVLVLGAAYVVTRED